MRRVSVEKATPGLELARPAMDKYGHTILPAGIELKEDHLRLLQGKEVWELLIEDSRVPDLVIKPLIKPEVQRDSIEAVRRLLTMKRDPNEKKDLAAPEMYGARLEVDRLTYAIVQSILKSPLGEPDLTGSATVEEFEFILPVQMTALAILLAREAGFPNSELINVGRAAMFQNIGYIWTPPHIWQNKDSLSPEDQKVFEKHPIHGYEALSKLDRMPPVVAQAVLQHHERWNGSGYPNGTKGWDISPIAQIIGIAETYYEARSARPNRKPYSPMDAFEKVMASAGELFDPELVQIFARRVPIYPSGVMVRLNTKHRGIITNVNIGHVGRPVVRICYDVLGNEVHPPINMDLSEPEHQFKLIEEILDL